MTQRVNIDRGAGIAVWRQIAEWVRAEVNAGTFEHGSRLPTETEIAERFGVNRHTVRRAIAALTAEGILRADQGRGTFVTGQPISYPITARTRFSEIITSQSREPGGSLIGSAVEEADALLAGWLDVPVGTLLIRLDTLSVVDGVPLMVGAAWLEQGRFPSLLRDYAETNSQTAALKRAGIEDYTRKETRISAELVDPEDARLLEVPLGTPVLIMESVNLDPDGRRIQYGRARVAAERIQIVVPND